MNKASEHNRRYRRRHPERLYAHSVVNRAIRDGLLVRLPCEECGANRAQAHHDDYSKPLSVRWLCQACHSKHHIAARPAANPESKLARKRERNRRHWRARSERLKPLREAAAAKKSEKLQARKDEAARLRAGGHSYASIGKAMGISKSQAFKLANTCSYD